MKSLLKCCSLIVIIVFFFSCQKESFTASPDAFLRTSVDTLHFDTVFTTTGSTSQFIKIINENNKGIHVSSVKLAGGATSPFKINVDGVPGPTVSNVDVGANDSVYIYVTVTINPNAANLPFIVRDSIEIDYNGNKKFVQLDAFGQNAHFFRNRTITANEIWNSDLPYVILGGLTVSPNVTLTINKSCHVHMHADAPFIVNGTLLVNGGTDTTRVVFTGDRLDDPYKDFPASYPGLIFSGSSINNVISYAIIKNAYQGIVAVNPAASGTKLTINETVIDNAYDVGIGAINTSITGRNLLISNCGQNVVLATGGPYNFTHCTLASFSNPYLPHKKPVLTAYDYYPQNGVNVVGSLSATFTNCIFWGEENGFVDNEVATDKKGSAFSLIINRALWRAKTSPANVNTSGVPIINQDPLFDSVNNNQRYYNFHLKNTGSPISPAINAGTNAGVFIDLNGHFRPLGGIPDLGCFEDK